MQRPPRVEPWLTPRELDLWVRTACGRVDYQRRLAICWMATRRWYAHEVAALLHVGRSTVWTWLDAYNRDGPAGLAPHAVGGRRWGFLTRAQEQVLLDALAEAAGHGEIVIEADLHAQVAAFVGHDVSPEYVRDVLRRHGWRKVMPRPRHPRADPDRQAAFKDSFAQRLKAIAADVPPGRRLRLLFEDEASFGRIREIRRCWAPPGMRPVVAHQQVRDHRHVLLAVCPHDGGVVWDLATGLDALAMSMFLIATRRRFPDDYCALFLDGAGWHIAGTLRVPTHMRLEFLPPYSPELNPVEPLWDHIREKYFANHLLLTLAAVDARLEEALQDLEAAPALVKSIANFSWIKSLLVM